MAGSEWSQERVEREGGEVHVVVRIISHTLASIDCVVRHPLDGGLKEKRVIHEKSEATVYRSASSSSEFISSSSVSSSSCDRTCSFHLGRFVQLQPSEKGGTLTGRKMVDQ